METNCGAIYCSKHPLYKKRNEIKPCQAGSIYNRETIKKLDCFNPTSAFFTVYANKEDFIDEMENGELCYDDDDARIEIKIDHAYFYVFCDDEDYEGES